MSEKPDLLAVLTASGVDVQSAYGKQSFATWCPFHGDSPSSRDGKRGRPNFSVRLDRQKWKCFRCNRAGDVYDFIGLKTYGDGWDARNKEQFKTVVQAIESLLNISLSRPKPLAAQPVHTLVADGPPPPLRIRDREKDALNVLTFAALIYNQCLLESPEGAQALAYIQGRGIAERTLRSLLIGWAPGNALTSALGMYPPDLRGKAAEAALLREDGGDYFRRRLTISDRGRDGLVYYMTGRSLKKEDTLRYLGLKGGKTIWGIHRIAKQAPVFMVESPMDAVSLWQCGYQAIAVQGTGFDTQYDAQLLAIPTLIIMPQNDKAAMDSLGERTTWDQVVEGQGAAGHTGPQTGWAVRLPHALVRRIPGEYKDINDILMDGGDDHLKEVIDAILDKGDVFAQVE